MKLGELSWRKFEEEKPEVALLPTGSTEQHGPHAPLLTDSLIAEKIAEGAAGETGALILPPIRVGVSREHGNFPGTLYLSPETFRRQLRETVISAHGSGLEKFVVVNGHGGNISPIKEACSTLYHDEDIKALEWTWFKAISARGMGHAGELETSLILYLREELITEPINKGAESWGRSCHGSRMDYDTSKFTEDGVVGDPRQSSAKKGEELFKKSIKKLSKLIEELVNPDSGLFT